MERALPKIGERHYSGRSAAIAKAEDATAETRRMRFVASDESVDRYGDIIRAEGWDLTHFRKNPQLLFGHDSAALPVGKVIDIGVAGTQLVAEAEFRPEGHNAFADDVWLALQGGFLNAVSVGFLPTKEPTPMRDAETNRFTGFEFVGQELLELSVVPVPANPQALAIARDLRISVESQRRLFAADERAVARVAAEQRARSITLARLRLGAFGGTANEVR